MMPAAPMMFCTITGWLKYFGATAARLRPDASLSPPAA
jgi:hypothetical protein